MSDCAHKKTPVGVRGQRKGQRRRDPQLLKPMRFASLHHHSTFSYLDGFQLPEAHVRRANELSMQALALTEHGNISSHVKLEVAAEKQGGAKPIFGCEFYTGYTDEARRTQRKYHLTVLAADAQGYRNLLQLVTRSWSEGFYYEPTINMRMLEEHKQGLVVMSGCLGSLLACSLIGGKNVPEGKASYRRGKKVAQWFKERFGDAYYLEAQAFPELAKTRRVNPMIAQIGEELGIPVVGDVDCHYTVPEEAEIQKVLHNVRPGERRTLEDMERDWGYDVPLCPPTTDRSIYRRLVATGLTRKQAETAIINSEVVAQRCNVTLPKLPMVTFPLPPGRTATEEWRERLQRGWDYRGCECLSLAERGRYKAQLRKEMAIIEKKGYEHYFLIIADAVVFAKDSQIPVGPARGSAAASLACWLMRITEVNPMVFPNLVFERFIDESREDMPDIDLDFASWGRPIVRDYLLGKYGESCVNNVGTFTYYRSKNSLDDTAKVHRIPPYEVDKIKELLIERSSGDLRASATIEDTVEQFTAAAEVVEKYPDIIKSMQLEGNIKGDGVHAAALVVSNGPITEVTAVLEKKIKGHQVQVVSMDKYDAERQGLIKMDFLALATMDMVAQSLEWLDMSLEELYSLPLDDEKVLDGFRANDVVGIFQFDGRAMRSVNGALQPDSFKEICDVNALSRPGPLYNGAANEYIDIKRGVKKPERIHEALDKITADTNYQIVYQEQILRIVREVGGFDWTHAAYIRKIISKKLGEQEFSRQWQRYWEGAQRLWPDMSEDTAGRIWGMCITAGSYAFNAAHSVSYGMLGYWTMWLKVYHPAIFYAASLKWMPKGQGSGSAGERRGSLSGVQTDRHATLMRDATRHGIKLRPPHPARSTSSWRPVGKKSMQAGFAQVEGLGPAIGLAVEQYRKQQPTDQWEDLLNVKGIGAKTVERMREFAQAEDPFGVLRLDRLLTKTKGELEGMGIPEPTHNAQQVPYERGRDTEIVWIGMPIQRNLRDIFESNRARTGIELKPEEVKSPELNEWVMILGNDGEEMVTLRINRWLYPKFRDAVWGIKLGRDLVVAQGVKPGWRTAREIYVNRMWVLEP